MIKNRKKYGAILEARMGSTRLPGKTLKNLCGEPLIKRVIDRIKCSKKIDEIILATTINESDDQLAHYVKQQNIKVYRGSEQNVLERVVLAAEKYNVENIVELHGDNPFLDSEIIDLIINKYEITKCDYISNTIEKTFPMGLRVQVFPTTLLKDIYKTIDDPNLYNIQNYSAPKKINRPDIRLTVDTKEDFEFVSNIYKKIIDNNLYPKFQVSDILNFIDSENIPVSNKFIKSKPVR